MAGIKDVAALASHRGKYTSEGIASCAGTWLLGEKRWSSSVEW